MDMVDQLKHELEQLYLKEGLTERVLELSRKLDKELIRIQSKRLSADKD